MQKLVLTLITAISLLSVNGQTNEVSKSEPFTVELTLGGAGVTVDGESGVGLDFSLSTNPFKQLPNLWVGMVQGAAWEPTFAGSTDINANWNWHVFRDLYLNTGWSGGIIYDINDKPIWRTGPEICFQYYVSDNSFVYTGVNYDIVTRGRNGFRYSFGIGLSF